MLRCFLSLLLVVASATLGLGCSSSSILGRDGGPQIDGGPEDAGDAGEEDGGCAIIGYGCNSITPCCDVLDQVCDPLEGICIFISDGGGGGGTLPSDGVAWVAEKVIANGVGVGALAVPSASVELAVCSGPGVGQILRGVLDAGWIALGPNVAAVAMSGIWADSSGDVFAVGQGDGGVPLWVAGNLDAGFRPLNLSNVEVDGGPSFSSLDAVWGFGSGEALAVGTASFGSQAAALHLLADGGITVEALPPELAKVYKLIGSDGGVVFALALDSASGLSPWVLERLGGVWTELPELVVPPVPANLSDITIDPAGTVIVVGDDGNGNGLAFTLTDGGFVAVAGLPAVPPLTAVCAPQVGELYTAASAPNRSLELLHIDGGLANGLWSVEVLPSSAQSINAITGDGLGGFLAGGIQTCSDCPGSPLVLRRAP